MKSIKFMQRIYHRMQALFWVLFACMVTCNAWASDNQLIPISAAEETNSGTSVAATILAVLQTDILPIIEIAAAIYILWQALSGLWKGYRHFQIERDMGQLKEALVASGIIVVVGGVILYLLDTLRTYPFS